MLAIGVRSAPARHPAAAGVMAVARALTACAHTLRDAGEHLDAWLAARNKARRDSTLLEGMSERELRDIGLDAARLGVRADSWRGDWRA